MDQNMEKETRNNSIFAWRGIKSVLWSIGILIAGLLIIQAFSCEEELDSLADGPLSFEVTFVNGTDTGSKSSPLTYTTDAMEFKINVTAIDQDGSVAKWFNGNVHVGINPTGKLSKRQNQWIELRSGILTEPFTVNVEELHGKTNLWIEDIGTDDAPGSYATGLSPDIWIENPTIRNVQETDLITTSPLKGDFVQINTQGRVLYVTGVSTDGFYVTDLSEPEDIFNGMYVYSHSRPSDVMNGDCLSQLSGTADEYYGFTELSFPSWKPVKCPPNVSLDVINLDINTMNDDILMEQYESRLVKIDNPVVCPMTDTRDEKAFEIYGQWKVTIEGGDCQTGNGTIIIFSPPDSGFDPRESVGETVQFGNCDKCIEGNLRYHVAPKWMIYPSGTGSFQPGSGGFDNY